MVKIIENLLKLTEFPFSYSFLGILLLWSGRSILDAENTSPADYLPFITLFGLIATTLTITDPFGRSLRKYLGFLTLRYPLDVSNSSELSQSMWRYVFNRLSHSERDRILNLLTSTEKGITNELSDDVDKEIISFFLSDAQKGNFEKLSSVARERILNLLTSTEKGITNELSIGAQKDIKALLSVDGIEGFKRLSPGFHREIFDLSFSRVWKEIFGKLLPDVKEEIFDIITKSDVEPVSLLESLDESRERSVSLFFIKTG